MQRLLSHNLWPVVQKLSRNTSKRAAIAYVSSDKHIRFGDGDILICDASTNAIKSGQTNAAVLMRAYKRGANIYSTPGLHAKIILLNEKAIIGSANSSESSAKYLIEAAILTDQPVIVSSAQAFISDLQEQSTGALNESELKKLLNIPVTRTFSPMSSARRKVRTRAAQRTWVIGVTEMLEDPPEDEGEISEVLENCKSRVSNPRSNVEWLRWTGKSRFRDLCSRNDWVVEMWRPEGRKNPAWVYQRLPVVDRVDYDSATYFFVEVFPKSDRRAIAWTDFQKLAKASGITRKLVAGSQFEITESQVEALQFLWTDP